MSDEGLFQLKSHQKLFLPSIGYKGLEKPVKKLVNEAAKSQEIIFRKDQEFVDAETGELLQLTKAKWTSKEGRLSMTAKTILDMGTGKLDMKVTGKQETHERSASSVKSSQCQSTSYHPLISQFLKDGPLTPMMHRRWNPLSDSVDHSLHEKINNSDLMSIGSQSSTSSASSSLNKFSGSLISLPHNDLLDKYHTESKDIVPSSLSLSRTSTWNRIYNSTYSELYGIASALEKNKSLTLEGKFPGGTSALKKACQQLV
jgi:hypothetical protein